MDFETAQSWFRDNRIRELSQTNDGLRFLKLRSLSRREHLYQLFTSAALTPQSNSARDLLKEAFNITSINDTIINSTIRQIYASEREEQKLIQEAKTNPNNLIKWLYENQGIRRFDASNRLFLVLIDPSDFFQSWKLKRAKPLLDSRITAYLDKISLSPGQTLNFTWEGKNYTVISDAIIITKPPG